MGHMGYKSHIETVPAQIMTPQFDHSAAQGQEEQMVWSGTVISAYGYNVI